MRPRRVVFALALFTAAIFCSAQERITVAPAITLQPPQGWKVKQDTRTTFLLEHFKQDDVLDASIVVQVEKRASHAEAVKRLAQIEAESPVKVEYSLVAGWPAISRKSFEPIPRAGEQERGSGASKNDGREMSYQVTVAVAIENYVVKLRELLQPNADPALADEPLSIART